jgi:hypothetical protein
VIWSLGFLLLSSCMVPPAYQAQTQAAPPPATGQEVTLAGGEGTEVLVEGVAASADAGIARDHALKDALRKAVEQGVGTFINSETKVQNFQLLSDKVYSQASGYVSSYRVVAEGPDAGLYRVTIRARVKLDKIEDDLAGIGILLEEQGRPRIMVVVKEVPKDDILAVTDGMLETEMMETMIVDAFQSKGFPVVDAATVKQNLQKDQLRKILEGDNQAAILLGLRTGAEVVVAGTVQRSSERRQAPYTNTVTDFFKVRLSARAVNVASAEVLGATALTQEVPFSEDAARKQVADSAGADLVAKILKGWKRHESITQLHCENADYAKVLKLKAEILEKVRGVRSVVQRDLTGSLALLEIVSETSTQEVLDDLGTKTFTAPFEVKGITGNRIDIKFTNPPSGPGR